MSLTITEAIYNFRFSSQKNKIMEFKIEKDLYEDIATIIQSEKSPVGIDAKKTHIWILEKLMRLEAQLDRIEKKLEER